MRHLLDAASTALAHGHQRQFAKLVLEAWRITRDPVLADSYELLLRDLQTPPLAGRDPSERAASWHERARQHAGDPLQLPVLLAEPSTSQQDELERLTLLEAWSPDPLLARTLAKRLRFPTLPPTLPGANEIRRQTIELLAAQDDPRQLPALDALGSGVLPNDIRNELRRAHARLAKLRPRPLQPREREAVASLERRAAPRRSFEARSAELLAAVHASPDADEPRLVYADWLAAHGDPRGEFISLQVERARLGAAISTRERELLARHGDEWAQALHGVLGSAGRVFARGFLHAGSVELPKLDGEIVELGDWSTLRILDGHVSDALARRGRLDHLRELYGFLQLDRFIMLRADNRLAAVESYECSLADPNLQLDTPLGLRSLLVRRALDDTLIALSEAPAIAGLEMLGLHYSSAHTFAADHRERRSARHRLALLCGRLPIHVRRLRLIDENTARASRAQGWVLDFERDELDLFSRLRVDWSLPAHNRRGVEAVTQLLEILDGLNLASLRRLELGTFDDPARTLAHEQLAERLFASDCELSNSEEHSSI